jgi:hypothetical protein
MALFNFLVADDASTCLELWDYLADWYRVEMGMARGEGLALSAGAPSDYVVVNYATWNGCLARFLATQLTRPSFRDYVLKNLETHRVGAMPTLYRPVTTVIPGSLEEDRDG